MSGSQSPLPPSPPGDAGLCASCRHAESIASKRSVFLRCKLSESDPAFPRYPRLPVVACAGYERSDGFVEVER